MYDCLICGGVLDQRRVKSRSKVTDLTLATDRHRLPTDLPRRDGRLRSRFACYRGLQRAAEQAVYRLGLLKVGQRMTGEGLEQVAHHHHSGNFIRDRMVKRHHDVCHLWESYGDPNSPCRDCTAPAARWICSSLIVPLTCATMQNVIVATSA